jgi:hypothetical protein
MLIQPGTLSMPLKRVAHPLFLYRSMNPDYRIFPLQTEYHLTGGSKRTVKYSIIRKAQYQDAGPPRRVYSKPGALGNHLRSLGTA